MKNEMNILSIKSIGEFFSNVTAVGFGIITTIFGYFLPIREVVHLMIGLFLLDVVFGYIAARKGKVRHGEKKATKRFSVGIIWNTTMPRMLISVVLTIALYMLDITFDQHMFSLYKIVGWFISGMLVFSIAQNGFIITKWRVFLRIMDFLGRKTSIELDENLDSNSEDDEEETERRYNKLTHRRKKYDKKRDNPGT